jgi:hypothetical protein
LLAGCYLAGIVTTRLLSSTPSPVPAIQVKEEAPTAERPGDELAMNMESEATLPPAVLERVGETADREQRARVFRLAGIRYEESGDLQGATRCYAQFLDSGTEQDLEVSATEDSWLLMALKADRIRGEKQ